MTISYHNSGALPSPLKTTMDDRKRAIAADLDDAGPPNKRLATVVNGTAMRMGDLDKEKDVEVCELDQTNDHARLTELFIELPEGRNLSPNEGVSARTQ